MKKSKVCGIINISLLLKEQFTTYFVGEDRDLADAWTERLNKNVLGHPSGLHFKALTNQEARHLFLGDQAEAAGIFIHTGGDGTPEDPLALADELRKAGYQVQQYSGLYPNERLHIDRETGLPPGSTISRWDIMAFIGIIEINRM